MSWIGFGGVWWRGRDALLTRLRCPARTVTRTRIERRAARSRGSARGAHRPARGRERVPDPGRAAADFARRVRAQPAGADAVGRVAGWRRGGARGRAGGWGAPGAA